MVAFESDIKECVKQLNAGGIILYPTDTIWGIGCDATNVEAVEKIFVLKNRPVVKSMIVLVAEEKDILRYVAAPDLQVFDFLQQVNTPTTVIYDNAIGLADNLIAGDGSIGIRICKEDFCRHLLKRFRKPIVSTSANISGEPAPKTFKEIPKLIKKGVDYIVTYKQDDTTINAPSSVVRWQNGKLQILRP